MENIASVPVLRDANATPEPAPTPPLVEWDHLPTSKSPRLEEDELPFSPMSPGRGGGNGDEEEEDDTHPLANNQVILTHLFSLCPASLLERFRLVNKQWYELSLPFYRSSVQLKFDDEPFYMKRRRVESPPADSLTPLEKFLQFISEPRNDCAGIPYRRFHLKGWEFRPNDDLLTEFWEKCAPEITFLELDTCYFPDVDNFRNLIYSTCRKLKSLTIKDYKLRVTDPPKQASEYEAPMRGEQPHLKYLWVDMDHETLPISWMELLSHFPSLTTLKLYNADLEDAVEVMLKAALLIRRSFPRKLALKHLDILSASLYAQEVLSKSICSLLRQLHLPLESLTIDLGVYTEIMRVQELLQTHATSLKVLNAYRGPISAPYRRFPFGVHLNSLQEFYLSDRLAQNMEFLRFTPNLRLLHIRDVVEDRPPHIPTRMIYNTWEASLSSVSLTSLVDLRIDYVVGEEDLRNLIKWMPSVQRLRMILNDKQFAILCQGWTSLEHLHVCGIELTDEGITGRRLVEDEEMARMLPEGDEPEPDPIRPNITNLLRLQSFRMDNDDILPTKLMDSSAFHGFLQLPHLTTLKLCAQMSDKARSALFQDIPNCEIVRMVYNDEEQMWDMEEEIDLNDLN